MSNELNKNLLEVRLRYYQDKLRDCETYDLSSIDYKARIEELENAINLYCKHGRIKYIDGRILDLQPAIFYPCTFEVEYTTVNYCPDCGDRLLPDSRIEEELLSRMELNKINLELKAWARATIHMYNSNA